MKKSILLASVATAASMSFTPVSAEVSAIPIEQEQGTRTYPRHSSRVNVISTRKMRERETNHIQNQGCMDEVEFGVKLQEHNDWYEVMTQLHLRSAVNVHLFIPLPGDYQAMCDNFEMRSSDTFQQTTAEGKNQIEHITKIINIDGEGFCVRFDVTHKQTGIDLVIYGEECADALNKMQNKYGEGLAFEISNFVLHNRLLVSYDGRTIAAEPIPAANIWSYLSRISCAETFRGTWSKEKRSSCCTRTFGSVTSDFSERIAGYSAKYFDISPA